MQTHLAFNSNELAALQKLAFDDLLGTLKVDQKLIDALAESSEEDVEPTTIKVA